MEHGPVEDVVLKKRWEICFIAMLVYPEGNPYITGYPKVTGPRVPWIPWKDGIFSFGRPVDPETLRCPRPWRIIPCGRTDTASWWLNQPLWKICASQNGFIFPNFRDENKKYLSCHHLDTWLITIVIVGTSPKDRVVGALPNWPKFMAL